MFEYLLNIYWNLKGIIKPQTNKKSFSSYIEKVDNQANEAELKQIKKVNPAAYKVINEIKKALSLIGNKKSTEASGNIDKSNILAIAKTGVNFISLGCLTHSAKPIDISLKVSK